MNNPFVGMRYKMMGRVIRDHCFGIYCRQNMDEFLEFLRVWDRPKNILEIGTGGGATLALFHLFAPPNAHIVSVDLWGGQFGAGYPPWKRWLFKSFRQHEQKQTLIYGNSHKPRTIERVKKAFGGQPIDLLFIDADHTYRGARTDFENYYPMVARGGLIAVHDIAENPDHRFGVHDYWNEIRWDYTCVEICNGGNGIGLIFK